MPREPTEKERVDNLEAMLEEGNHVSANSPTAELEPLIARKAPQGHTMTLSKNMSGKFKMPQCNPLNLQPSSHLDRMVHELKNDTFCMTSSLPPLSQTHQ